MSCLGVLESFDHVDRGREEEVGGDGVGLEEQLPSEFQPEASPLSSVSASLICSSPHSVDESTSSSPSTGSRTTSAVSRSPASTNSKWACDYSDCGRFFPKRHDLK
jgi:hypothetical protein